MTWYEGEASASGTARVFFWCGEDEVIASAEPEVYPVKHPSIRYNPSLELHKEKSERTSYQMQSNTLLAGVFDRVQHVTQGEPFNG